MGLDVGRLDRRITIERATAADDGFSSAGGATWATLATVSAEAKPVSDGERIRAQQVGAAISMRFTIHWTETVSDVDPRDRIQFDGRLFDVTGVKELGRREGLEITAAARSERA